MLAKAVCTAFLTQTEPSARDRAEEHAQLLEQRKVEESTCNFLGHLALRDGGEYQRMSQTEVKLPQVYKGRQYGTLTSFRSIFEGHRQQTTKTEKATGSVFKTATQRESALVRRQKFEYSQRR